MFCMEFPIFILIFFSLFADDHSRVSLKQLTGKLRHSHYINANYVDVSRGGTLHLSRSFEVIPFTLARNRGLDREIGFKFLCGVFDDVLCAFSVWPRV